MPVYDEQKAHYIVITSIIIKDGRYLIAKRSSKEKVYPGQWTVPGGKLNHKDYTSRPKDTDLCWYNVFEGAVRREVLEEVGLRIRNLRYLTSMAYVREDGIPTVIVSLFADYDDGEVKLAPELTEYAWVTLEDA